MSARRLLLGGSVLAGLVAALLVAGVLPSPAFLGGEPSSRAQGGAAPPEEAGVDRDLEDDVDLAARPHVARARPADAEGATPAAPGPAPAAAPGGLVGVVLRGDGRPATNARVTAVSAAGVLTTAVADAEGRFHLDVPAGRYDLVARAGFDGGIFLRGVQADGRPLAMPLRLRPAADLRVEVSTDGHAVGDAVVRARFQQEGGAFLTVAEGATDVLGVVSADAVPSGAYVVEVTPRGGALYSRRLDVAGTTTAAFDLPLPVRLSGVVSDAATHAPVAAGVEVTVVTAEGLVVHVAGQAAGDGSYALEVPRGKPQAFLVTSEAYAPYPSQPEVGPVLGALGGLHGPEAVAYDVALRPGAVVRGLVTLTGTKQPVPALSLRFVQDRLPAARTVSTIDDGTYAVKGLGPGTWRALIETPGWYAKNGTGTVQVAPPGADGAAGETRLDLEVWSAGQISGRVVQPDGAPISGARVWLVGGQGLVRGARRAGRVLETTSGADGGFLLDDVPSTVAVRVRASLADAESVPSDPIQLADGVPPPLLLTLGPTIHVSGVVTALDSHEPVAGASVRVDPVGEPGGRGGRSATTGPDGRFEAASLIPGGWRFTPNLKRVYLPGEPKDVTLAADPREVAVALTLDPGLVVAGGVVDAEGRAVGGARVQLAGFEDVGSPPPEVGRTASTDPHGAFRFSGLRSGRYRLTVSRKGFAPAVLDGLRGGEDRLRPVLTPPPPVAGD